MIHVDGRRLLFADGILIAEASDLGWSPLPVWPDKITVDDDGQFEYHRQDIVRDHEGDVLVVVYAPAITYPEFQGGEGKRRPALHVLND